jgi:hypothetical protein
MAKELIAYKERIIERYEAIHPQDETDWHFPSV